MTLAGFRQISPGEQLIDPVLLVAVDDGGERRGQIDQRISPRLPLCSGINSSMLFWV